MKLIKIIGSICLICFTFFYTERVIDVIIEQDEIMIKLKDLNGQYEIAPINALIIDDTIIPGSIGKQIDLDNSYKAMKKIGTFEKSLITYEEIYPNISIYNNYDKYIIKGNTTQKQVALVYILNNDKTLSNIINITKGKNVIINFFIDSTYLNNNIGVIDKIKNNELYNYGLNGNYTKDNIIINNNIINNKSNNKSTYCLFLNKNINSLNNCSNSKMLSLMPTINGNYLDIKNNLESGSIIIINNTAELASIIDYIKEKGYNITGLSNIIKE